MYGHNPLISMTSGWVSCMNHIQRYSRGVQGAGVLLMISAFTSYKEEILLHHLPAVNTQHALTCGHCPNVDVIFPTMCL